MPASVMRVVLGLTCVASLLGLWLGTRHAQISETEVINSVVGTYVAQTGGSRSECVARPSPLEDVWMVINCGTASSSTQYAVDPQGRLIAPDGVPET
jgi:hypothetical protein